MFAIKKVCLLAINNTLALLIWRNYFRDFHNISRTLLLRIPLQINRWNTRSLQTIGNFSTRAFSEIIFNTVLLFFHITQISLFSFVLIKVPK